MYKSGDKVTIVVSIDKIKEDGWWDVGRLESENPDFLVVDESSTDEKSQDIHLNNNKYCINYKPEWLVPFYEVGELPYRIINIKNQQEYLDLFNFFKKTGVLWANEKEVDPTPNGYREKSATYGTEVCFQIDHTSRGQRLMYSPKQYYEREVQEKKYGPVLSLQEFWGLLRALKGHEPFITSIKQETSSDFDNKIKVEMEL